MSTHLILDDRLAASDLRSSRRYSDAHLVAWRCWLCGAARKGHIPLLLDINHLGEAIGFRARQRRLAPVTGRIE